MAITVHKQVVQHLQEACQTSKLTTGFLIGLENDDGGFTVAACAKCTLSNKEAVQSVLQLAGGLSICGIFYSSDKKVTEEGCNEAINSRKYNLFLEKLETDDFVVCNIQTGSQTITENNFFLYSDMISPVRVDVIIADEDDKFLSQNVILRTQCSLPLSFTYEAGGWKENLESEITDLSQKIMSSHTVYHLQTSSVILCQEKIIGIPEGKANEFVSQDLYNCLQSEDIGRNKKRRGKHNFEDTLHLGLYMQIDGEDSSGMPLCAPIVQHKTETFQVVEITLPLDVVTVVSPQMPIGKLSERVSSCIVKQLDAMKDCICKYHQGKQFFIPESYQFKPFGLGALLNVVYPHGITETDLQPQRKKLHETLCLSLERPSFKRANVYRFPEDRLGESYLINPHVGLNPSGVKSGKVHLVQGQYTYHHYMQDRFDDNKWGCAYRSLQTLVSWFRLQGYTDKPVPSHREIQQALVDVGDKESNFVGSRKWIGSMEVSYCLDHLIGITSRIMTVNTGGELSTKGRELALHFETQGSPIMIGGGVLAHTILGVDYSEVTGDIKFLILDPHYTGGEDLKVIQDKGWCGWKGPDFWDKTAHYNLCMPQRPNVF
ncbi:hypothetical protein ScPMuIL_011382 [Solemya velum]